MRELRSIVNAFLIFAVFLLAYAWVRPGYAHHARSGPRFLRMEVENFETGSRKEKVTFSVPYAIVDGALRIASTGNVTRELDTHFAHEVDSAVVRDIWKKLQDSPDGTEVPHDIDGGRLVFSRAGSTLTLIALKGSGEDGRREATLRFPARLLKAAVSDDRDFDVDALVDELARAERGDLIEVTADDAHVRVWVE